MPDLPTPVRTAHTLMTGLVERTIVAFGAHDAEVGAAGEHERGLVHEVGVRDVGVREDDLVDASSRDQSRQLGLGPDGDAVRVARARRAPRGRCGRRCRGSGWR